MDCVYFVLVRSSAKCSFSHTNESLLIVSCDYWSVLIELLEPLNSGRLVRFYCYMCYSNTSWRALYNFHRNLYAVYQTKYLLIRLMVKQACGNHHFNSSHG